MNIHEKIASQEAVIKRAHSITRAIRHKLRLRILDLLEQKGKLSVTELFVELRLDQSTVSQHLAILQSVGIVKSERDGKLKYYSINESRVELILEIFALLN